MCERFDFVLAVEEQDEHKLREVQGEREEREEREYYSSVVDVRWCCLRLFGPLKL